MRMVSRQPGILVKGEAISSASMSAASSPPAGRSAAPASTGANAAPILPAASARRCFRISWRRAGQGGYRKAALWSFHPRASGSSSSSFRWKAKARQAYSRMVASDHGVRRAQVPTILRIQPTMAKASRSPPFWAGCGARPIHCTCFCRMAAASSALPWRRAARMAL